MLKLLGEAFEQGLKRILDVIGGYTWEGKEGYRAYFGPPPLCASHFKDSIFVHAWANEALLRAASPDHRVYTRYGLSSYNADLLRPPDFLMSGLTVPSRT